MNYSDCTKLEEEVKGPGCLAVNLLPPNRNLGNLATVRDRAIHLCSQVNERGIINSNFLRYYDGCQVS